MCVRTATTLTGALVLTVGAAAVEGHPADAAVVVVRHPEPGGHAAPLPDLHLHPAALPEHKHVTPEPLT